MSVSREQSARNVASATRVQARALGYVDDSGEVRRYADLSASERISLTNAVARYVAAHPELFDTGEDSRRNPYRSAAFAQNDFPSAESASFGDYVAAVADEERDLNPFDPRNRAAPVRVLVGAALFLGVVYVLAKTAPSWVEALKKSAA